MQYKKKEYGFNIITEIKNVEKYDKEKYESAQQTIYENPEYTEDALIIQAILEYSIEHGTEKHFIRKDITDYHLFPKHKKIFSKIEDRSRNDVKKAYIQQTIETYLEKLTYLELVESEEYECTNKETSKKYIFTKLARMIALLLSYEKSKTEKRYEATYDQMFDYYDSLGHSHAKFCLVFFFCCYIIKRLDEVMYSILELLYNAPEDKDTFLNQIRFLNTVYRDSEMWQAFQNAIDYLKRAEENKKDVPKISDLFLLNLKLTIEEIHENKSKLFKQFEVFRLKRINNIDEVVLEAYCSSCNRFQIIIMKTIDYLDMYIQSQVSKRFISNIKCKCNRGYLNFDIIV